MLSTIWCTKAGNRENFGTENAAKETNRETKRETRRGKGLLKTLEAVIAILMIMTILVTFYGPREEIPQFTEINWKLRGFNALYALDQSNELRPYVMSNDTTTITRKLAALLPGNIEYEVYVCGLECSKPGVASEELVSVSYIIAGDVGQANPRRVLLYIW